MKKRPTDKKKRPTKMKKRPTDKKKRPTDMKKKTKRHEKETKKMKKRPTQETKCQLRSMSMPERREGVNVHLYSNLFCMSLFTYIRHF